MIEGIGHGKVILFGEHFVVHGAPAIAGGIANRAIVRIKRADNNSIVTKQKVVPEYSIAGINSVLGSLGVTEKYEVHLEGDLPTYGGLGSSAAFCVGLVRAVAKENGVKLNEDEVNKHAYNGEKAFHGNPSGVDNTIATHRGVVEFRRGTTPAESKFEFITLKTPMHLAVSFSGEYSATAKMVAKVQQFKDDNQEEFAQLVDEYLEIFALGKKAIETGNIEEVGRLMNANQALLKELGVSYEHNEKINAIALRAGAFGAKVTGGGGGGCCIALAESNDHAEKIAELIRQAGFESFATQIVKKD